MSPFQEGARRAGRRLTRVRFRTVVAAAVMTGAALGALPSQASAAMVLAVPAALATGRRRTATFDLQAHRGGRGLLPESTLPAFENALRLGVSTLELDVAVTADGVAVVTHDPRVLPETSRDTAPAVDADPLYPYVGRAVHELTAAQVATLDCGSADAPRFPARQPRPGARMPRLPEVLDLVVRLGVDVDVNVETKVDPTRPGLTASPEAFVAAVVADVRRAGLEHRVMLQSFDWRTLRIVREKEPRIRRVALVDADTLRPGPSGRSPWLGGLSAEEVAGDPVRAAAAIGADVLSPSYGTGRAGTPGFAPFVTERMVDDAHAAGLAVVPWTVNDAPTMDHLIALGVDGLITDRPDLLRDRMAQAGLDLPARCEAPEPGPAPRTMLRGGDVHAAVASGCTAVKVPVRLVDGVVTTEHGPLEDAWLVPLERLARSHDGRVRPDLATPFVVSLEVRGDARATYVAIDAVLRRHAGLLTRFAPSVRPRAVSVVVTGAVDLDVVRAQRTRHAALEVGPEHLGAGLPSSLVASVGVSWSDVLGWFGAGEPPAEGLADLRGLVARAHHDGHGVRLRDVPDVPGDARTRLWSVLLDAGVDRIVSRDAAELTAFVRVRG